MKSWFYELFGLGKIPALLLNELQNENLLVWDEGVPATITYLNFRAPGRYSNWKRRWISGAFGLTQRRLVVLQYSMPVIDILLTDERFRQMQFSVEGENRLLITFEPGLFLADSTGKIEWRFRSSKACEFAEKVQAKLV